MFIFIVSIRSGCQSHTVNPNHTKRHWGVWWFSSCPDSWHSPRRFATWTEGAAAFLCLTDLIDLKLIISWSWLQFNVVYMFFVCQIVKPLYIHCVSTGSRILLFHVAYSVSATVEGKDITCKCHKVCRILTPCHQNPYKSLLNATERLLEPDINFFPT